MAVGRTTDRDRLRRRGPMAKTRQTNAARYQVVLRASMQESATDARMPGEQPASNFQEV